MCHDSGMKRRHFLSGLAALEFGFDAFGQESPSSVYIPKAQRMEDRKVLLDFMDEFAFGMLVTAAPEIHITHIPIVLDRTKGKYGTLMAHLSRNNPQHKILDGKNPAVVVFRGPHRYISPSWYQKQPAVPTWNFAVVHASGRPKSNPDRQFTTAFLERLVGKFEGYEKPSEWSYAKLPDAFKTGMMGGIMAFEMEIDQLEGKFKLGLEREADRDSMLQGLQHARPERNLYEFTKSFRSPA